MINAVKASGLALFVGAAGAVAGELDLKVEIPQLDVAEYHKPYVAVWVEDIRGQHHLDLALWYDHDMRNGEGTKWLKDLRLWWRRSGRQLDFPVDGFSGATRPVGVHQLSFSTDSSEIANLPAGQYQLIVEAAREVGGRELVKIPFDWPSDSERLESASGTSELGRIELKVKP